MCVLAALVDGLSYEKRCKTLTAGDVMMRVKDGDITKERADAIVNSTNEHVDLTTGICVTRASHVSFQLLSFHSFIELVNQSVFYY